MSKKLLWITTGIAAAGLVGWVLTVEFWPDNQVQKRKAAEQRGLKPQAAANAGQTPDAAKAAGVANTPKKPAEAERANLTPPSTAKGLPFLTEMATAEVYDYKTGEKKTVPVTVTAITVGDTNNPPPVTVAAVPPAGVGAAPAQNNSGSTEPSAPTPGVTITTSGAPPK